MGMLRRLAVVTFFALFACEVSVEAAKMPPYLPACSRNDPNLNDCARKVGLAGIPSFINGDRKYRIPNLNPMEITELVIDQGTSSIGLKIRLKDIKVWGIKDTTIEKIQIDLENKYWAWHLRTPVIELLSTYNVTGRVLLLPIFGSGPGNVTLTDAKFIYNNTWTPYMRNGVEYLKINKGKMDYTAGRIYIGLENLFNGDRLLGPQMNKFLNENWEDASREIGPSIALAVSTIIDTILTNIAELVPYDEIFLK